MKRIALILILALVSLPGIFAETVLLCMSESGPELDREDWPVSVMRAVEDGILDVFFEEGHIVTNAFFEENTGEPDPLMPPGNIPVTTEDRIMNLANIHGAGAVLYLIVCFSASEDENLPVPEKFEYTVYRRAHEKEGPFEFLPDYFPIETEASILDFCTSAGKLLAGEVSSMLKGF